MKKLAMLALFCATASVLFAEERPVPEIFDLTGMSASDTELPSEEIVGLGDGKEIERIIFLTAETSAPLEIDTINVLKRLKEFKSSTMDGGVYEADFDTTWEVILERSDGKIYYIKITRNGAFIRTEGAFAYGLIEQGEGENE